MPLRIQWSANQASPNGAMHQLFASLFGVTNSQPPPCKGGFVDGVTGVAAQATWRQADMQPLCVAFNDPWSRMRGSWRATPRG
jgi:hypothetical protein